MTVPVDDPDVIARILANTDALLLDFDGPICSVFAGFPAPVVARQLAEILTEAGHVLPPDVAAATDPFDLLHYTATLGGKEAELLNAAFRAHEVEAIHSAEPTPGAHALIKAWKGTHRNLAIVSNNSRTAVETYLDLYDLHQYVDYIAARTAANVSMLKPNPHLVSQAVDALGAQPARSTLVGDSTTDIEAANAAQIVAVGYANKAGKVEQLMEAKAAAITTEIQILLVSLHVV
ncbi:HAD family phosphatase [Kibdelosporangium persicum]|uniref:HAD family hydrolase n=1 Tax=Kibdelosporangium persicum TaxID=2698649 RepID=UPI0028AD16F1|nr:HAD family phosphatase [Kibdelosporangium persicum]